MGFGHRVYKNYDPRAKIIKEVVPQAAGEARPERPALRSGPGIGGSGAERSVLHRAEAVSERRFLLGHHLPADGHPEEHVHGALRPGPAAGLDRPLARNAPFARQGHPPPEGPLRGPHAARVRAADQARPLGEKNVNG